MKSRSPSGVRHEREQGFVLISSLMFMVVLTILGLSIMGTHTMEERMSGFFRDRQLALESAEAGLREAERDILYGSRLIAGAQGFLDDCSSDGLCLPETDGSPIWADLEAADDAGFMRGEDSGKTVKYGTYSSPASTNLALVAAQPRYLIEVLTVVTAGTSIKTGFGPQSSTTIYRVTSVGFGRRASTRVVLQGMLRP
jgi:type IV pilus assembly protein PilX